MRNLTKLSPINWLKENKGFTLVEVMIASAAMGGLALVLMQIMKTQTKTGVDSQIGADVSQFKTEVQTILNNPAHCSANFRNMPANGVPTNVSSLVTCDYASGCSSAHGQPSTSIKIGPVGSGVYKEYSNRLRIISYSITVPNITSLVGVNAIITNAKLAITVQKVGMDHKIKPQEVYNFYASVVVDTSLWTKGCPRSLNSTIPY